MVNLSKTLKIGLATSVLALTLGACSTPQPSMAPLYLKDPIQIAESIERLELYSRPDGMSLSQRDQNAVAGFLDSYGRYGNGPLYMNVPSQPNAGVSETQTLIQNMMGQMGMSGADLQQGQYASVDQQPSPVIISFRRLKALPKDCTINSDLTRTYNNQTYPNFGCSANSNLAAMIQDPRQLIAPHDLAPADMRRRMEVYDKYIKGESTTSELPERQLVSSSDN